MAFNLDRQDAVKKVTSSKESVKRLLGEITDPEIKSFVAARADLTGEEVVLDLVEEGWGEFVIDNFSNLAEGVDSDGRKKIILALIEKGGDVGWRVAKDLLELTVGIDSDGCKEIVLALIEKGRGYFVIKHRSILTRIKEEDHGEIMFKLIDESNRREAFEHFSDFTGVKEEHHKEIALRAIKKGGGLYVAQYFSKLTGIDPEDHKSIALKIIERNGVHGRYVAEYFSNFTGIELKDHGEIAFKIIEAWEGWSVIEYFSHFTGIKEEDHWDFVSTIITKLGEEGCRFVAEYLPVFTGISPKGRRKMMPRLIESGGGQGVAKHFFLFHFDDGNDALDVLQLLLEQDGIFLVHPSIVARELPERYREIRRNNDVVRYVLEAERILGSGATTTLYRDFVSLHSGNLPTLFKDGGVTASGEEGVTQLKGIVKEFRSESIYGIDTPKGELFEALYKGFVRFDITEFHSGGDEAFKRVVKNYEEYKGEEDQTPLNEHYTPSGTLAIRRKKNSIPPKEFVVQFEKLTKAITEAQELVRDPTVKEPFEECASHVKKELENVRKKLEEAHKNARKEQEFQPEDKSLSFKIRNLEKRKNEVEEVQERQISSIEGLRDNLAILQQYETLHHHMRVFFFVFGLVKKQEFVHEDLRNPETFKDVLTFVDTETKETILTPYFEGKRYKRERKLLGKLINATALSDHENRLKEETEPIICVPTRNLLTEFSGHVADACWAGEYSSVLHEFPNLTSLMFVQGETKEILGSALLLETETEDGERLLIIRGINPRQEVVDTLDVTGFCNQLFTYIKEIAQKDGRMAAVAIDNGDGDYDANESGGGYDTNRLKIHTFLRKKLQPDLGDPVRLGKRGMRGTGFNGYELEGGVYRLDSSR